MPPPRHYRAPPDNGGRLIEPPKGTAGDLLASNRDILGRFNTDLGGRSFQELRREARTHLIREAANYTQQYRPENGTGHPSFENLPLILSGHQPELFHPGVWYKNFLLSQIACRFGGLAINLVVDHDTLAQPAIAAPTGTYQIPRLENVFFDASGPEQPFEERQLLAPELAVSFAERVLASIDSLRISSPGWSGPLAVEALWPSVCAQLESHRHFGRALAAGRHILEGAWGLQTLELPCSRIWDSEPFRHLCAYLLLNLPRLHGDYNAALAEYRRLNGLKSVRHPMPDLATEGDWLEAPLWQWSEATPVRERMFVRRQGDRLEWRAGRSSGSLGGGSSRSPVASIAEQLAELRARGIKLRPRALLTTLYARLFLGDLFLHGIGGAKYDEVTDGLIERFFGCLPPKYMAATATLRLPLDLPTAPGDNLQSVRAKVRDLVWHGERFADSHVAAVARKKQLLAAMPPRGQRKEWHGEITAVNRELATLLVPEQARSEERLVELGEEVRRAKLLGSREFSFCLFPAEMLRKELVARER